MLRTDSLDTIYYRVSAGDGRFIAGDEDLPLLHQAIGNPTFGDAHLPRRAHPHRELSGHRSARGAAIVTVAETLHKRNTARRRVLQTSLAVDAAQLAIALVVIWLGVRFAIAPLRVVEQQLAARGSRELEPFSTTGVPLEIRGLIDALNRLMGALHEAEQAERSFLENAAHQLRTPLAGMLAQLELLSVAGAELSSERVQAVLAGGRRLARTTHQLLSLARSDAATRAVSDLRSGLTTRRGRRLRDDAVSPRRTVPASTSERRWIPPKRAGWPGSSRKRWRISPTTPLPPLPPAAA